MKNPRNIAITGASSGLGAALALHYAHAGVTLHLSGRDHSRLKQVADMCAESGASTQVTTVDVTDKAGMENWITRADNVSPIDLLIANAGISAGIGGGGESTEQVRSLFATNIDGVINTIQPLIPAMVTRRRGQIAIMSSLAGIRGLPSSPAYSASKACVRIYGEGLRGWLKPHGVEVNVICPGFIRTPMTAVNPYRMPLMMDADKAARIIAKGLARNQSRIAFPLRLHTALWLASILPLRLTDPLFARLPAKPSVSAAK